MFTYETLRGNMNVSHIGGFRKAVVDAEGAYSPKRCSRFLFFSDFASLCVVRNFKQIVLNKIFSFLFMRGKRQLKKKKYDAAAGEGTCLRWPPPPGSASGSHDGPFGVIKLI